MVKIGKLRFCFLLYALACLSPNGLASNERSGAEVAEFVKLSAPELLTFDELVKLSDTALPSGALKEKLHRLLNTPFISNEAYYRNAKPHRPSDDRLGPFVRACFWNIERGLELEWIKLAFADPEGFKRRITKESQLDPSAYRTVEQQLNALKEVDILMLNEVDLGMTRTEYRDVARELAEALNMNYAFGVEFVEVDKLNLGLEEITLDDKQLEAQMRKDFSVDRSRYRGLHGTAILSRYPIKRAEIFRLKVCYDWYLSELKEISKLETGRREAVRKVFLERISREVRHGNRMALIADLAIPELPTKAVTVVATHLENKCPPQCRRQQMKGLLWQVRDVKNPVILAGDFNTTGSDAAPTSVRREISKRVKNPKFWAKQLISWLNPVDLPRTLLFPAKYFKNYLDPTATHVPFFASNPEAGLFKELEGFRFSDGFAFDFRGAPERTINNTDKTLANSNQRIAKGFKPTFSFQRDYGGLVGNFKLDWFIIKPFIKDPLDESGSYLFAPHFPMTLQELNEAVPDRISDHNPITVDLPLTEPKIGVGTVPAPIHQTRRAMCSQRNRMPNLSCFKHQLPYHPTRLRHYETNVLLILQRISFNKATVSTAQ